MDGDLFFHISKERAYDGKEYPCVSAMQSPSRLVPLGMEKSAYDNMRLPYEEDTYTLCNHCMTVHDQRYIDSIPLEDLPLYINYDWITAGGHVAYKNRLQTLK